MLLQNVDHLGLHFFGFHLRDKDQSLVIFLVEAVFLVSAKLTAALPILVVALVTICVKASICALGEDLAFLHLFIIRVHN